MKKIIDSACITISGNLVNKNKIFNWEIRKKFKNEFKSKNALISVSNKENLISLLKTLKKFNINIISSGGTYTSIRKWVTSVLSYQNLLVLRKCWMEESKLFTLKYMLAYYDRQNKKHKSEMSKQNFPAIDLIVVNFYPFQK